jgi:hypothetical protein
MTPDFEHDLQKFMKIRHIKTKSEAVRTALREGLEHSVLNIRTTDFSNWLGLGKQAPVNKKTKFGSDDDLWK